MIKAKLPEYGAECVFQKLLPDDDRMTTAAIREAIETGAELVPVLRQSKRSSRAMVWPSGVLKVGLVGICVPL